MSVLDDKSDETAHRLRKKQEAVVEAMNFGLWSDEMLILLIETIQLVYPQFAVNRKKI